MSNQENRYKHGVKKLEREIKKRMTTTIVGIIASVEKAFDHRFPENYDKASKEELAFQEEFDAFREEAFDKGNNQLRQLLKELEQYNVEYIGYQFEFKNTNNRG